MKKVTVVFPMAGSGQRFGNKFKPFLKIFNRTFIELAIEPFLKHEAEIKEFVFIVRTEHQQQFNVIQNIRKLNLNIKIQTFLIDRTDSVIETISVLFENKELQDIIFCDCDHSLNVDEIFNEIQKDRFECIIPGWKINPDEAKSWSIAAVDGKGNVTDICEKEYPKGELFYGVIGCYYFKNLSMPPFSFTHISDIVRSKIGSVKLIPITEAEFFGDPQRLHNLYISKNAFTIFCDLDGTIIEHENIPDYTKCVKLLPGAKEKIDEWRKDNGFIVLTTSRDEQFRPELEEMLRITGIRYEYLVMGLPSGARYLVNDKKPYSDKNMAKSFEVERNVGIRSIGHSFASFEIKNKTGFKSLPVGASENQLKKFKSQYDSMKLLKSKYGLTKLIPKVSGFDGQSFMIEYLSGYKGLHEIEPEERIYILKTLGFKLEYLYTIETINPSLWFCDFLKAKIYSKENDLIKLESNAIGVFRATFKRMKKELTPQFITSSFHGDLTYENIMVKGDSIQLIDFDNDNLPGAIELDLGKLMQSILTGYEYWDKQEDYVVNDLEFNTVVDIFTKLLNQDRKIVIKKAYFYAALHLIRMVPYQANRSVERAKKAANWSISILNKLNDGTLLSTHCRVVHLSKAL